MRLDDDGHLQLSPSDLNGYLACKHLTTISLAVAHDELTFPRYDDASGEMLRRKGNEFEAQFLASLAADGIEVTVIERGEIEGRWDVDKAVDDTLAAMRVGAPVIYQATLRTDGWIGYADFLERIDRPSGLGDWSYEGTDTKLARNPRPSHVMQLCFYSQVMGEIQGLEPERVHILLGSGRRDTYRLADFGAYYRSARRRLLATVEQAAETYPARCEHCSLCDFQMLCKERWRADDHLTRVAGIRLDQIEKLAVVSIETLTGLAEAPCATSVPKLVPSSFLALHEQAELQLHRYGTGELDHRLLPLAEGRGFARLPRPSPGDLFLDLEDDQWWRPDRGLVFLYGLVSVDGGEPVYEAIWGHDEAGEQSALERLVDLVCERRTRTPEMHVYHYSAAETSTIKRLMSEYGTRENEVDDLLRREVFVDLYAVVRQALRLSVESYSIKEVEAFYGFERAAEIGSGMDATVTYEQWVASGEQLLLDQVVAYNEEDCLSTLHLRDWLLEVRPEDAVWHEPPEVEAPTAEAQEIVDERERLQQELADGEEPGSPRLLLSYLLDYHRREAKPSWWLYFDRLLRSPGELVDDGEAIGELAEAPDHPPYPVAKSQAYTLRYPAQQHRIDPGDTVVDPATRKVAGEILSVDDDAGFLVLKRGRSFDEVPLPKAIIPEGPYSTPSQRAALIRLARSVVAEDGRYSAVRNILEATSPLLRAPRSSIQTGNLDELRMLVGDLKGGALFVQGPPGAGKTYSGARIVTRLIKDGRRVGITATSHKAIHNFLDAIEEAAKAEGIAFQGLKRGERGSESAYDSDSVKTCPDNATLEAPDPEIRLLAGTSWLFTHPGLEGVVDTLVIDEAGQVSLADALAMSTCARNVVLLGDPLQLAQVSQGSHPEGSGCSVLEHLLADDPTIPPDRGVFLEESWRMHPDVCAFISEVVYDGRLATAAECERQGTAFGTGIRFRPVEHGGNSTSAPEEAALIAREIETMVGGAYTNANGETLPLTHGDFMVVAPYNRQVRCLRETVPDGVRVGTVDKFQGQEAPVVFFSMTSSSGEDVPRNLEFLFSRNRLNVAISRARCLAFLVASPRLLEARCRTIEQMRLANALCRFVEMAR